MQFINNIIRLLNFFSFTSLIMSEIPPEFRTIEALQSEADRINKRLSAIRVEIADLIGGAAPLTPAGFERLCAVQEELKEILSIAEANRKALELRQSSNELLYVRCQGSA